MAPLRYVPPHKWGARRAAAAGGGMEPEEEIAEAELGEQRRLGTARRVSARTPSADSVRCRREVRFATVAGFPPAEEECWETDSESDGWVTDDEEPDAETALSFHAAAGSGGAPRAPLVRRDVSQRSHQQKNVGVCVCRCGPASCGRPKLCAARWVHKYHQRPSSPGQLRNDG